MRESKKEKRLLIIGSILLAFVACIFGFIIFIKTVDGKEITKGDYVVSITAKGKPVDLVWNKKNGEKIYILSDLFYLPSLEIVSYNGDDEKVVIPKRFFLIPVVSISDSAFKNNGSIKEVVIPSTVRAICSMAFCNCTALEEVKIKGELYYIKDYAFYSCSSITELNIPYSHYLNIGKSAFENCSSLETVNFNNGNVGIGTNGFYDCCKLETVQGLEGDMAVTSDAFDNTALLENYDGDFFAIGSCLLKYLGNDRDVAIPENITRIAYEAFIDMDIDSIHMPSAVTFLALNFRSDNETLKNKVKVYYGIVDEFDVYILSDVRDNVVLVAPAESEVIDFAKRNDIEYIAE